jgi:carnitine-CoA ligase
MTVQVPESPDPRLPPRDQCVLRPMLDRWAREQPEATYVKFWDGSAWTYADLHQQVRRVARGLETLSVKRGDRVVMWLPNGPEGLLTFFGINYLGAVFVPINTSYRGGLLEHVLENSDAELIVAHAQLASRLADVDLAKLGKLVVVGGTCPEVPGLETTSWSDLAEAVGDPAPLDPPLEPWDTQSIMYTSGTTGPSKGVLSSYLHIYSNMGPETWPFITKDDRYMVNMPLFHIGGLGVSFTMLTRGGSIAMLEAFDTKTFWQSIRETETTVVFFLGVMASFVNKLPPQPDDRDHPLRLAFMVPLSEDIDAFSARFGIDIYTIFNMTEISTPIISGPNPTKLGTCGKAREGVEVRLVDENDCEVPMGQIGEMIVRTDRPWAMNHGYYKNPKATADAWRNGWFHTGDAFRMDEDRNFYFVDRMKDAIRRRGENISSFEVEAEVTAYPDVQEVAAIAVPAELSEDEVMIVVAPVPGKTLDPAALIEFLVPRMAHFMVPRYVRIVDELPKTPTAKVQKVDLRAAGVTNDTWDREAHGIRIKREKLA